MKKLFSVALVLAMVLAVAGCSTSDPATYVDGTYTVAGDADSRGYVQAKVTIAGDEITAVEFTEFTQYDVAKDYATYGNPTFTGDMLKEAHEGLATAMIEANTWDVDAISGATSTSGKAKTAAKRALEAALADQPEGDYFDGTFQAISSADSRGSFVIALVTISDNKITAVDLRETVLADGVITGVKDYETYGNEMFSGEMLKAAHDALEAAFIAANSADVELVSGATGTSEKAIEAVEAALERAKR